MTVEDKILTIGTKDALTIKSLCITNIKSNEVKNSVKNEMT